MLAALRCPLCGARFAPVEAGSGQALRCANGHCFDISREGYVNLKSPASPHSGDSAAMIEARARFLSAGHYAFLSRAIIEIAPSADTRGLIVEAGAGTGHYLGAILDSLPDSAGLALDVSKPAVRRAARAHPRMSAVLCDIWGRLPLEDSAAGILLDIFAPRNAAEFARVLAPTGTLIVVTPAARHLAELVDALALLSVEPGKEQSVAVTLAGHFDLIAEQRVNHTLSLDHVEIRTLAGMGPSAWHAGPASLEARIAQLPEPATVTASVRIGSYRRR